MTSRSKAITEDMLRSIWFQNMTEAPKEKNRSFCVKKLAFELSKIIAICFQNFKKNYLHLVESIRIQCNLFELS